VLGDVAMDSVAIAECVPSRLTDPGETPQVKLFPLGTVQVSATVRVKFASGEIVNVELVDAPGDTLAFLGDVVMVKFGGITWKITPSPYVPP